MWTVSVLLDADRYRPSMLNASEQMLTHLREETHTQSAEGEHTHTVHTTHTHSYKMTRAAAVLNYMNLRQK